MPCLESERTTSCTRWTVVTTEENDSCFAKHTHALTHLKRNRKSPNQCFNIASHHQRSVATKPLNLRNFREFLNSRFSVGDRAQFSVYVLVGGLSSPA